MFPGADLADVDIAVLWRAIETAAEQAGLAVWAARIDCIPPRMVYASPLAAQIAGRDHASMIGLVPWAILREEDQPKVMELVSRPPGAPPVSIELVVERPDGRQLPIELAGTRIHTAAGMLAFGYFRDVTSERETLAALRQSEARFRFLVEVAPDGVVILKRGTIVFINPKAARLLGVGHVDEALGQAVAQFLPPEDAAAMGERIETMFRTGNEMPPNEYGALAAPERVVEIKSIACEWEGGPAVLAFARDVTERKAIQRQLGEADRLASLGTLAAGVAHEINNPLTFIQLSAQRIERVLAAAGIPDDTRTTIREHLRDIDHGISRVASITQSLRTFARVDDAPPGPVDLGAVVDRALRMVDNDLRHRARLIKTIAQAPPVTGNASRLEQVVVNLMLNAIQALPSEGEVPHEIAVALVHEGEHVGLEIRDTGRGIAPAVRERIFDPFFTTRAIGEGMGLGLAVSKTIIESFGGTITIDSTEGVGTTARLALRVHRTRVPAAMPVAAAATLPRRRILIVDDERLVRDVLARLLSTDHDVVSAGSGEEALAAVAESSFDVVFCDVMMPGMNGRELYRRVAAERPGLEQRFVFMSGGTFNADLDQFLAALPNRKLPKPFKLDAVFAAIADADR